MKAVILEKGNKLRRIHDLLELSKDIERFSLQLPASIEELDFLNRVYHSRYPPDIGLLPHGQPTKEDAQKALEITKRVLEQVERMLQ